MKLIILLTSLLTLVSSAVAEGEIPMVRTISPELQPKIQFLNPQYLLYLPTGNTDAKLPLLIFLHGAGGVGSDIQEVKSKPTEIWEGIQKFKKGPCIVVAPQCLKKSKSGERGIWTPEDLNLLL